MSENHVHRGVLFHKKEMPKCNWEYFKWHHKLLWECLVRGEVKKGEDKLLMGGIYRPPNSTKENDEQLIPWNM